MGRSTYYELEVSLVGKYTVEELRSFEAKLNKIDDLRLVTGWNCGGALSFSSAGEVSYGEYEKWAHEVTVLIFRALGSCDVYWSWYYRERDPDDCTTFDADDYDRMIPPLEQLAGQATK